MSKFGASQSKFVSNATLKTGDEIEFLNSGAWQEVDFSQAKDGSNVKTVFQIDVSVNAGARKTMSINATSGNALAEEFGSETEGQGWKGRKATVTFMRQLAFGKVTNVLVLMPVVEGKAKVFQGTQLENVELEQ